MTIFRIGLLTLLLILISACSKPLPEDKKDYAGLWTDDKKTISLLIQTSGEVSYERKEDSTTVTINAPLKEFNGDNFVVGIGFMTTDFIVSEPPTKKEGKWQMVVDGVQLTKLDK
jgi:hypothetical protein